MMWKTITIIIDQIKMFIDIYLNQMFKCDLAVHVGEIDFPFSLTERGYSLDSW
jgi:hypothetical protein